VRYDLDQPALGPVGAVYRYADTNYILLGLVIEKITGHSYYAEVERRLLDPLHLDDTHPSDRAVIPGLVDGYTAPDNPYGLPVLVTTGGRNVLNPEIEWTGGGLVSNTSDLARWGALLYGGRVLTAPLLATMLADTARGQHNPAYGLAVYERHTSLGPAYGHDGDYPGYWSVLEYYPRYDLSVAMQFNTDDEHVLGERPRQYTEGLARRIVEIAHLEPHE
jgi:D-alanyl-D-alanine carboxypeptidase